VRVARAGLIVLAALGAVVATTSAIGQPKSPPAAGEEGPKWQSLTAAQQAALGPLRAEWPQIDAARKRKWIEVAARFPKMSAEEQQRVQERMTEWARLSPEERGRARVQFQEARQLPAVDRQERWEAYQALPEDERRALAERATTPAATGKASGTAGRADGNRVKSNVVSPASVTPAPPKPVAPTVVQANPGATTTLVSKPAAPPAHHQAGLPKITATQGFVDPTTLLPKRGPQGAGVVAATPAPPAAKTASSANRP
jgi:hypothetical protein